MTEGDTYERPIPRSNFGGKRNRKLLKFHISDVSEIEKKDQMNRFRFRYDVAPLKYLFRFGSKNFDTHIGGNGDIEIRACSAIQAKHEKSARKLVACVFSIVKWKKGRHVMVSKANH